MRQIIPLLVLCVATRCLGGSLDIVEFESPASAPIYVIDGDIHYNESVNGVSVSLDWYSTMDPATGSLKGDGPFTINGSVDTISINWAGTIGADMNVKVAGSAVRVNGKLNMNGSGTINGSTLDRLSLLYTFSNFDVNAQTGQMAGYVSLKGSAKLFGRSVPLNLPKTYLAIDLPDSDMNGEWDNSMGDWKISDIDATVDSKGKITGTGDFSVLDNTGTPYDIIGQKISGTVKNGVVSLTAVGNSKSTAKIKEGLTYRLSDGQPVTSKSSVSAYGQNRKF
jgi:hypothetical protein